MNKLPAGWEEKYIEEVFEIRKNYTNARKDLDNNSNISYLHYGDIHKYYQHKLDCKNISLPKISENKLSKDINKLELVKNGDLIVVDVSEDYKGICSSIEVKNLSYKLVSGLHTLLLRDKGNYFADGYKGYIFYNHNVHKECCKVATGISVYGINRKNLRKIKIPIPPLDEQKRIAAALSKIDAYLENTIKLIEEKERFKRGIAKKLLTCKEGENIPEARFKGFEDEWEETQILEFVNNNIIKIEKGKSITKSKIEEGDIPVIAGGKTPPYYHNKYNYNFPCITISASGSAGYVWFHDYKIWASDCHVIYTDNKRYNIKFLYHYLKNIQDLIYYLQVGGVQKHVYAKDLIELNIPNITIKEQEKIGEYLSLLDEEIDNLKKQKELIKEMKKGAMQKLLSGEVRLLE